MDLFGEEPEPQPEVNADDTFAHMEEPEENFVHPRLMTFCEGHEQIEKNLIELYNADRLPHALLFSGVKGIGKATFAYRFARFLLKHGTGGDPNQDSLFGDAPAAIENMNVSPDDGVFQRIASGGHADLMTLEREYDAGKNRYKGSVDVAQVRKVLPFLRMTASEGGWRVVVIDDADTMNRNAQNALLKILEEPPAYTMLILVTHRAGALIPTIKSRSQSIHFNPLGNETMMSLLERAQPHLSDQEFENLIDLSGHSFGTALTLIEDGGLETFEKSLSLFNTYPTFDWGSIHQFADEASRNGQEETYKLFTKALVWAYEMMIRAKARGQSLDIPLLSSPVFGQVLHNSSLETLLKTCENLSEHFAKIEAANLDKRQGVIGAFSMLQA